MPTIVISYRREDTRWIVGRIFDRLVDHYGHDSIFMDIDGVPAGVDYRDEIRSNLQRSNIVLAVIGPQWLAVQKETGQPRIADETDWVRIEIEAALEKKITVIPVLIDRARLPKPSELPETIREFAYRQAADIDTGVDFQSHIDRLIRAIDQLLDQQSRATKSTADLKGDQVEQNNDRSPLDCSQQHKERSRQSSASQGGRVFQFSHPSRSWNDWKGLRMVEPAGNYFVSCHQKSEGLCF